MGRQGAVYPTLVDPLLTSVTVGYREAERIETAPINALYGNVASAIGVSNPARFGDVPFAPCSHSALPHDSHFEHIGYLLTGLAAK